MKTTCSLHPSRLTGLGLRHCQPFSARQAPQKTGPGGGGSGNSLSPICPHLGTGRGAGSHKAATPDSLLAGTSVIQVTAVDADDPTVADHTSVVYQLTKGKENFDIRGPGLCD